MKKSFVPSTGYLYFYSFITFVLLTFLVFRPLYGVSLFLRYEIFMQIYLVHSFVPSTGYLYFYFYGVSPNGEKPCCFVPSTGYLYFYEVGTFDDLNGYIVSSPLRGISISTKYGSQVIKESVRVSSPLRGISISTKIQLSLKTSLFCFVPSTGYLYFYGNH